MKSHILVAPGTSMVLRFEAYDFNQDVKIKGAVVRSVMNGMMGIEFFEVEKKDEDFLRRIIEERLHPLPFSD